jgi:hypothetical protein
VSAYKNGLLHSIAVTVLKDSLGPAEVDAIALLLASALVGHGREVNHHLRALTPKNILCRPLTDVSLKDPNSMRRVRPRSNIEPQDLTALL